MSGNAGGESQVQSQNEAYVVGQLSRSRIMFARSFLIKQPVTAQTYSNELCIITAMGRIQVKNISVFTT